MTERKFTLPTHTPTRAAVIESIATVCTNLDVDTVYRVQIVEEDAGRSKSQNDLMWVFHGVVGQHIGDDGKTVHRTFKLSVMLPWMEGQGKYREEALFIRELLKDMHGEKLLYSVDKFLTTTGLTQKEFASLLESYILHMAPYGVVLESNKYDYELMRNGN